MEYETALPPAPEQLNYYDLLSVAVHLDRANDRLTALWHDVLGKPAFKDKAAEYANDLNNLPSAMQVSARSLSRAKEPAASRVKRPRHDRQRTRQLAAGRYP